MTTVLVHPGGGGPFRWQRSPIPDRDRPTRPGRTVPPDGGTVPAPLRVTIPTTTGPRRDRARRERSVRDRRWRLAGRVTRTVWTVTLIATAVVALWPARLGGATTFVVVQGHSMDPTFHLGDVVYVRSADEYRPGDVVVYRVPQGNPGAGIQIVHRLRRVEPDGTLVLRGDNNPTEDVFRPTRADVVGKVVADLGPLPRLVLGLAPLLASIGAGAAVVIVLWPDRNDDDPDDDGDRSDEGELAAAPAA